MLRIALRVRLANSLAQDDILTLILHGRGGETPPLPYLINFLLTKEQIYVIIRRFDLYMVYACDRGGRFYQPPIMVDYLLYGSQPYFFAKFPAEGSKK